jgi:hypothetical protein
LNLVASNIMNLVTAVIDYLQQIAALKYPTF